MDKEYNLDLDTGSYFENRDKTIQSMNLSTSLIRQNRDKIYSKIFYVFSLIFTVFIAMFSNSLNWLAIFFFLDLSMIFLVWNAKEYCKRRNELGKGHYKIIDRLTEFEIKIDKM
jgi:Ca2+/Na+ antiporter